MESSLKKKALLAGVSCLLMIALAVIILFAAQGPDKIEVDCSEGIALIHSQESGSIDSVRKIIQDIRKSKLREECEERIEVLQNDNSKVWPMFEDFLFFGDSRCVALVYDGYFTDTQCIAEYGVNIRSHLEPNISLIEAAQPAYVYLAYGVNDISCGNWTTGSAYAEEYAKIVDEIHAASPDTKIM